MRRDLDETLGPFLSRSNKQGARKDDAVNMKDTGKMVSASWYEYEKGISWRCGKERVTVRG